VTRDRPPREMAPYFVTNGMNGLRSLEMVQGAGQDSLVVLFSLGGWAYLYTSQNSCQAKW
jgi:hypothetical protein